LPEGQGKFISNDHATKEAHPKEDIDYFSQEETDYFSQEETNYFSHDAVEEALWVCQ
jgi:hypothetical protein